ncbi:uncharacterized protein [Branchiostoma lanceolatum]|uniref:uncharacterized protein n=1 Tax=Branchiostoma lanceolatum TaxID=7740 RepID=UPI0034537E28
MVRWVQHSREDRLHHLPSILPHIRFNLLTSDDTAAILEHPLVREDPGISAIRNVVKETSNCSLKRRVGMDTLEMVLLFNESTNEILYMNPLEGKFISCSKPKILQTIRAVTVTTRNEIYILAHELKDYAQMSMFEYNHSKNVWEYAAMSSLTMELGENLPRYSEHLVEVDRILYYLDVEMRRGSAQVEMKKYNWLTEQWKDCSLLHTKSTVDFCATVACGSHLYFLVDSEMHRYSPSQDQWDKRTQPSTNRPFCTAVAMGTELFCTDDQFARTMVYDTESDNWQELKGWSTRENPSRLVIKNPRLFVLENQLYNG